MNIMEEPQTNNLDKFREWLLANGKSLSTANTYFKIIRKYLRENEFNQEAINKFASTLINNPKTSQNQFVTSVKSYGEFLGTEISIKYKTINESIHDYITEKYLLETFLPAITKTFRKQMQLSVLFRFLFYTGLRKNELLNLKRDDINFIEKYVTVRNTKGKKDRNVPFPDKICAEMTVYFTANPETQNAFNISIHDINRYIKIINDKKIFDRRIHLHLFRHSCAKHLILQGVDISIVQKVLGHRNIKTTMLYVDPDEKMVREIYHKFIK